MKKMILFFLMILFLLFTTNCKKKETEKKYLKAIKIVRVNWTGVTIKTSIVSHILKSLGYKVKIINTSVPLVYKGLSKGEVDIFLGNWMPSMAPECDSYFKSGTVINYSENMKNAKYTLAVPTFVAESGLKNFEDISKYKDKLEGKIYGIEAGNDGNKIIKNMIDNNKFNLGEFKLISSSEAGMLAVVKSFVKEKKWIVFLAWSPHQMNKNIDLTYLNGSTENTFGPNNGSAIVYTNIRNNFEKEYPEITLLLKKLEFSIDMMNEIMDAVNNNSIDPDIAGMKYLKDNPKIYEKWLNSIKTINGGNGLDAFKKYLKNISK